MFGIREICNVVLKAKAPQKIGNKLFYKNEPVIRFDTLKTSSIEGSVTTVYANGGRGNARLVSWDGERTVTWNMEDALISAAGIAILTGAGLIEASAKKPLKVHTTEQTDKVIVDKEAGTVQIVLEEKPFVGEKVKGEVVYNEDYIYVMRLVGGEVASEPYIPDHKSVQAVKENEDGTYTAAADDDIVDGYMLTLINGASETHPTRATGFDELGVFKIGDVVLVDYYVEKESGVQQIEITADKFGGNYYLEASTLARNTDGVDLPAEFIIPNCRVQSNFNFSMAASGDPSSFSFVMDCFPDYTRFDKTQKVFAAIQIIDAANSEEVKVRTRTSHDPDHEKFVD